MSQLTISQNVNITFLSRLVLFAKIIKNHSFILQTSLFLLQTNHWMLRLILHPFSSKMIALLLIIMQKWLQFSTD